MSWLRIGLALSGLLLFAWLLLAVDAAALRGQLLSVGIIGFGIIMLLYALEFLFDVISWQLLLGLPGSRHPLSYAAWIACLYGVRMAGESVNVLTPLGGMGGEPVKAIICHRHYGVPLSRGSASLVLAKTLNVLALVVFLGVGLALMLNDPRIDVGLRTSAVLGLGALTVGIVGFVAAQGYGLTRILERMSALGSVRLRHLLDAVTAFDRHLHDGYLRRGRRFLGALALGFGNWIVGAVAIMVTLELMGRGISFSDAWIVEAMAQMVRAATFVVPASIGAQEGVMVLTLATLTGDPALGLAVALIRRAREIVWVAIGAWLAWRYVGSVTGARSVDQASR